MVLCGVCLVGFTSTTLLDVRDARCSAIRWLWPQEVTSAFFIYGVFVGAAVATRRNDHLHLSAITEAMTGRTAPGVRGVQPRRRHGGRRSAWWCSAGRIS